jgi:hypothetical protein
VAKPVAAPRGAPAAFFLLLPTFFDETGGDKTPTDYILKRTKSAKLNYINKQKRIERKLLLHD